MKKFAVIGNPIKHSLSPALHNWVFKSLGIDAEYEKKRVFQNQLAGIISDLHCGKLDGINVTIPHKENIMEYLDEINPRAKSIGAVNLIMKNGNKLIKQKWDSKRKRLKYHLKQKNINNLPRLIVFRSNKNIFSQLVDDANNRTILSVSSIDKELKGAIDKAKSKIEKSTIVGTAISEQMKKDNIKKIIFDRNGYKYHGRIKAVGDAIRSSKIKI